MLVHHSNALTSVGFKRDSFIQRTVVQYGIYLFVFVCGCICRFIFCCCCKRFATGKKYSIDQKGSYFTRFDLLNSLGWYAHGKYISLFLFACPVGMKVVISICCLQYTAKCIRAQQQSKAKHALNYLLIPQSQKYK